MSLWQTEISSVPFRMKSQYNPRIQLMKPLHESGVIMGAMASQINGVSTACSTVCLGADQRKHQSCVPLAFVRRIHRWLVNSPHKGPVARKMFPFDDVILIRYDSHEMRMLGLLIVGDNSAHVVRFNARHNHYLCLPHWQETGSSHSHWW